MCGRYLRRSDKQCIADAFRLGQVPEHFILPPDFNVARSTFQPVIRLNRDSGQREMVRMRWGLVPYFAKSLADGRSSPQSMPKQRRCKKRLYGAARSRSDAAWCRPMASMSGRRSPPKPKPYAYTLSNGQPFVFGGLWDAWKNPETG